MNHSLIGKLLKNHGTGDNSNDYTPTFVSDSARSTNANDTGIGYYTPTWFGIHNPNSTDQTVTVWTVDQGTGGAGVTVRIKAGETFYATVSKLTVAVDVVLVLLGTYTTFTR